jgi:hypothetical protein
MCGARYPFPPTPFFVETIKDYLKKGESHDTFLDLLMYVILTLVFNEYRRVFETI